MASHSDFIESLTYSFQSYEERTINLQDSVVKFRGATVAPNFFELLALSPLAGRSFLRMAIGAGCLRLACQLLVESFTLAGLAAVLGIFIAWLRKLHSQIY